MSENKKYPLKKYELDNNRGVLFANKKEGKKYSAYGQACIDVPGTDRKLWFRIFAYTRQTKAGKTMNIHFLFAEDEDDSRPPAYEKPKPKQPPKQFEDKELF